jgi:hypothetical protein
MKMRVVRAWAAGLLVASVAGCDRGTARVEAERLAMEASAAAVRAESERREAEVRTREAELAVREQQVAEREQFVARRELEVSDAAERLRAERAAPPPEPAPAPVVPAPAAPPLDPSAYQPAPAATPVAVATPHQAVEPEQAEVDPSTFYEPLQEHGSWFESASYGYVWRPSVVVVNTGWRPYTLGRWAYTDCGWTWVSAEPFGWACYHYGRWVHISGTGWVWIPGGRWGPAWVAWRVGNGCVGWAPLGPGTGHHGRTIGAVATREEEFCFVESRHFGEERIDRWLASAEHRNRFYRSSRDATRIRFDPFKGAISEGGPPAAEIDAVALTKPPKLRIEKGNREGKGSEVTAGVIRVNAPPQRRAARPREVAGRIDAAPTPPVAPAPTPVARPSATPVLRTPSVVDRPTTMPAPLSPLLRPVEPKKGGAEVEPKERVRAGTEPAGGGRGVEGGNRVRERDGNDRRALGEGTSRRAVTGETGGSGRNSRGVISGGTPVGGRSTAAPPTGTGVSSGGGGAANRPGAAWGSGGSAGARGARGIEENERTGR